MKRSLKEWALRVAVLLAGLCVAHFGVTLFLLSDLGSDPFNVLIQGLCRTLSRLSGAPWLSHGRVHIAVSLLILAALFFVDRSYIKIGTALCMALGGPIIDFFSVLLAPLASSPLAVRICLLVAGCVILAFGMTMVIRSDAGTGPNDLVALVVSRIASAFPARKTVTSSPAKDGSGSAGGFFAPQPARKRILSARNSAQRRRVRL